MERAFTSEALSTRWGAVSETGAVRRLNEDSFLADHPVFLVADGMGGHEAGEQASAQAVAALRPLVGLSSVSPRMVQERLAEAQARVRAIETTGGRSAGTTVTGVVVAEQGGLPYWLVLNIGDSRTYRLEEGRLEQISVDHSEVQEMVDAGLLLPHEAAQHPRRHVVTRALGAGPDVDADFWLLPIGERDRVLVCSDGLTTEISEATIAQILVSEADPQAAAQRLVEAALVAGGRDNITALVIDAQSSYADDGTAPSQPSGWDHEDNEDTVPSVRVPVARGT